MGNKEKTLIVIAGPTAVGKTKAAIALAGHLQTEILSSDSRQFYRQMRIGTARPEPDELEAVPHHFIAFLDVQDEYSAGQFEREALQLLEKLFQTKDVVVMAGGSGLYADAVCEGLDELPSDPLIREELMQELDTLGIEALQKELKVRDPEFHDRIDLNNPHRLVRALEVCRASGLPYSSLRKEEPADRPFRIIRIALEMERELLYSRINERVLSMMERGLEEEAKDLLPFRHLNSLNTVGYKELFDYFDGKTSREEAIALIQRNTRRFAKRQLTWLRKDERYHRVDAGNTDELIARCDELLHAPSPVKP